MTKNFLLWSHIRKLLSEGRSTTRRTTRSFRTATSGGLRLCRIAFPVDVARLMASDNQIGVLGQRPHGPALDHLNRIGAKAPVPSSPGCHEERMKAGDLAPSRVDPLFHRLIEHRGNVSFPSAEMRGRGWWIILAHGRQRSARVGSGLANVDAMALVPLVEDPHQPGKILVVRAVGFRAQAVDQVEPRQEDRQAARTYMRARLIDVGHRP